jgi:diguanylate cyclase (GGDEF)-like protein/PAS domain S-box-containing protein
MLGGDKASMYASSSHTDAQVVVALRRVAAVAAVMTALLAVLVLAGWTFNLGILKSPLPGQTSMKPLTALGLLAGSAALWLQRNRVSGAWRGRLALICAGALGALGALVSLEYLLGMDLGLDQVLFRQALLTENVFPIGRPAPATAVCFLLLALALLVLDARPAWLAAAATLITLLVAGLALMGYIYAVTNLYQIGPYVPIALHTALAIGILAVGLLAARPEGPIVEPLTTRLAGGLISRRLLPAVVVVPFVLGWLGLYGQRLGLYDTDFGSALLVAGNVVVFATFVYVGARLLNQADAKREAAYGALRLTEENQRLMLDSIKDHAIFMLDTDGRVATWNAAAERIKGYTAAEIIGQPVSVFYPPEEASAGKPQRALQTAAADGAAQEEGYRVRKDGSRFWAIADTAALRDERGVLRGYSKLTRDITERKQAETALREREERLRVLADATPNGLIIVADSGQIAWANQRAEVLFGYGHEKLIGRSIDELVPHRNQGGHTSHRADFASDRRARPMGAGRDLFGQRQDGNEFPVEIGLSPVETSQGKLTLASIIDITERKKVEEALRQLNAELESRVEQRTADLAALMDNIPDTIYFKDRTSRFTRINLAQARLLGVATPELAVGKTDADFQAPQLAAEFYTEEQRLLDSGQPVLDRPEFNPTPAGEPRWLSSTKVPLKDASGQVVGLVGISRDITARMKAEEEIHRANQLLADRVLQLSGLNRLEEQLQACLTIEETYPLTAHFMGQLAPSQVGALYVVNADRTQMSTVASWGAPAPELQVFGLDDCWALRRGQVYLLDKTHQGLPCRHLNDVAPIASVCIPLMALDQPLGMLHLRATDDTSARTLEESAQQLGHVVADSLALTWANLMLRETLRQQAIRDPLTGLFNRRFMEESLARELHRAARLHQGVSLIMMDIDHFKQVNDRFGHETGDAVLRALGLLLLDSSRGSDIPCRYGGEEFLLILPEASIEIAGQRAEQIRERFRHIELGVGSRPVGQVSLSLGVAAYPQHGDVFEAVLRAADAAMYRAKTEGRDRTTVAST